MKVLYLTNLPAPYTVEFLTELGKHCDLTVVFERHSASDRDKKWKTNIQVSYKEIYLEGKEIGTENSFCPSVKKYLKDDYDHIIIGVYSTFTAMYAMRYLKKRKKEYIISTDGGFISDNESKFKKRLKTSFISDAVAWLSTCSQADEYLNYYGATKDRIYRYPFTSLSIADILDKSIDTKEKLAIRNKLGISASKIIIGVGQLIERKGWDILLEALQIDGFDELEKDDIKILIVGGEEDKFRELIDGNEKEIPIPSNVRVVPFMSKSELFDYYKASDIFVLPTREDVWGLVINEAMANGLPVISTNRCNAALELVENNVNGLVVSVENSEGLAKAIKKLLYDEELSNSMGRNNIDKIKAYTYESMGKGVYNILLKIGESND